jgi:hypothetical protein
VHCDAYAGFNELFGLFPHRRRNARAGPGRLKRSICFSHARRKLYEMYVDNNAAERSLRDVALGRRSYLFAGSDAGGERAAAMYSLIGSCKLSGIDPEAYLRYVFERIADHPINRIDELLPCNVRLSTPQAAAVRDAA